MGNYEIRVEFESTLFALPVKKKDAKKRQCGNDFLFARDASPDGAALASGGEVGFLRLCNGGSGNRIKVLPRSVEMPKK
jgi:hypothetical protein